MNAAFRKLKTALVPISPGFAEQTAISLAKSVAEEVVLVGVVCIAPGEPVSAGAKVARKIRKYLLSLSNSTMRYKSTVIVSEHPWVDLQEVIRNEKPNLLLAEWKNGKTTCGIPITEVLSNTLCNVAIVRGGKRVKTQPMLLTVRGGPHAELALSIAMRMKPEQLDVLHLTLTGAVNDAPFKGIQHILPQIPEVNLRTVVTEDIARSIYEEANQYNLVVLGATAGKHVGVSSIGPVAEKLLRDSTATVMLVKAQRLISAGMFDESAGTQAISILVDKWFAENTFHAKEFSDLEHLLRLKEKQGATISLALPALNEEKTVGKVITTIKTALMDEIPLLDEMVLLDSNSTDQTRQIAEDLGIPVYIHQNILPEFGARVGKGEALWKSLFVTHGDIIAWIDTDIVNISPLFVYGIIGPLLINRNIQFVKGFYRRPIRVGNKMQAGGGGRVTELTARPLLNLFYPELSGIIQPLSGEYAGRRESLEKLVFFSGYGVETGLLIEMLEQEGLKAIAQVDLLERIHHNQGLEALSKMSFVIIQTVLRKLETRYERSIIEDVNKTMKLIHYARGGYYLDVEEVVERERPPMISLSEYLEHHRK
jgi:nucleotide-binding universal stress UspA family protein